jgi:ABC-type sugar transport system ATPase subunit
MVKGCIQQLDIPAKVFNNPVNLTVAEFMESGNLASIRHSQQVLDKVHHQWPRDTDHSGYWLFKPQHLSLNRSLQNTGITLINSSYTGRGYQHEIAIQLNKSDETAIIWKAETENSIDFASGTNLALEYTAQPHWLKD